MFSHKTKTRMKEERKRAKKQNVPQKNSNINIKEREYKPLHIHISLWARMAYCEIEKNNSSSKKQLWTTNHMSYNIRSLKKMWKY